VKALVATASKHGSTLEVGERIANAIASTTPEVEVVTIDLDEVADKLRSVEVSEFDVAIIGSAIYFGRWMDCARSFVESNIGELTKLPVWLFSVGPIGDPPHPEPKDAVNVADIIEETRARGHVVFSGMLDRHGLGFSERAMVTALRAPDGDFREWEKIEAWGHMIAVAEKPSSRGDRGLKPLVS
jgi:menaquinone-dependent protoporphyrinogen oxidase